MELTHINEQGRARMVDVTEKVIVLFREVLDRRRELAKEG